MTQRKAVSILNLILLILDVMLQKFGLIYTTMFSDLPL